MNANPLHSLRLFCMAASMSALLATAAAQANVLDNGDFEIAPGGWVPSATFVMAFLNASLAHSGIGYVRLGGYHSASDSIHQDVAIPSAAASATLRFWYRITAEGAQNGTVADTLVVTIESPTSGATLATLASFSNLTPTQGWAESPAYDVSSFRGQDVRLKFKATTDSSDITTFLVDDVSLVAPVPQDLTVYKAGSGTGTVVSSPAGINCGETCRAGFDPGAIVTLEALPSSGSLFAGWSGGGCTGTGACTVTMNASPSITAGFRDPLVSNSSTALTSSPIPSVIGQAVTFTAEMGPGFPAFLTGTVTFKTGTTTICAAVPIFHRVVGVVIHRRPINHFLATAECTTSSLSEGPHIITAEYSGDVSWSPSISGELTHAVLSVAAANPPRLVNIATRMEVLTGNDVLIGGFVIAGSAPKRVLIRARGPSLVVHGVPNALANPVLSLFSGQSVIASNDDWGYASNFPELQATGAAPEHALEAAALITLTPGPYTAMVSGAGGGTGVGLIEVFELGRPDVPLINIATRGRVGTGDNVLIGGFIIHGSGPQTVVVRARGPSLSAAGVPNVLMNPLLKLYSGQTEIASNDDWQTASNFTTIQSSGFAPADSRESAIYITLNPGAYTAIVQGVAGTTGVGIVEVFAVP